MPGSRASATLVHKGGCCQRCKLLHTNSHFVKTLAMWKDPAGSRPSFDPVAGSGSECFGATRCSERVNFPSLLIF